MSEIHRFQSRLQQIVATPSVSCTAPEFDMPNTPVADLLATWLEDAGFNAAVSPVAGSPGKANVVATLGRGDGGLVLSGHTDTVPCNPDQWHQDPFSVADREQRFYGLGVADMKGFFPTLMAAVERCDVNKIRHPLIILGTADEESSMCGARALTASNVAGARFAVIGEPTGMKPIRMHKGIMMEAVRIKGLSGHSSDPALGRNALDTMRLVLNELVALRAELQRAYHHPGFVVATPTLNLGSIHGGDNPNRICGQCELHFDLRPVPGMHVDDLHAEIERRLVPLAADQGTSISLEQLFPGINPFEEHPGSDIVKMAEALTGSEAGSAGFATEAHFLQSLGLETIVMGPGSIDQAHQPNEYLDQRQIMPAVETLYRLIERFCC